MIPDHFITALQDDDLIDYIGLPAVLSRNSVNLLSFIRARWHRNYTVDSSRRIYEYNDIIYICKELTVNETNEYVYVTR